ncbi:MAG TPA: anti-sigma factor [Gaiellaceae bacterium]|nr:anti-sigma factor [Gaiellaceae bacterium]
MREPPDFRDLVGDDVPPEELERLARADALLRRVPAPPAHVPESLTRSVARVAESPEPAWPRRRLALGLALAAALAALSFGVGRWTGDEGFETRFTVAMQPTENARAAAAVIRVGERDDASGNWQLELEVSGLPPLARGETYDLWLAKDGEYAASCGTFSVGEGETTVRMTASYRLSEYDTWVITKHGAEDEEEPPWLLRAPIA